MNFFSCVSISGSSSFSSLFIVATMFNFKSCSLFCFMLFVLWIKVRFYGIGLGLRVRLYVLGLGFME